MQNDDLIDLYRTQIETHRNWLTPYPVLSAAWTKRLNSSTEGAICEAILRDELSRRVQRIRPAEDASTGGPDFECTIGDKSFFVECTCIGIEKVSHATNLPHPPTESESGCSFSLLTNQIRWKCRDKVSQLHTVDGPRLLAICTLHSHASYSCMGKNAISSLFLDPKIAVNIDKSTGHGVGGTYQVASFRKAAFTKPDENTTHGFTHVRPSVSAILLCGFGCVPTSMIGALHPDARRIFDPTLLPGVEFGYLEFIPDQSSFRMNWTDALSSTHGG